MYLYKFIITVSIIVTSVSNSSGKEYLYYTQYMFNGLAINPAYAGSNNYINITCDIRKQWVGMKGAPSTQTFSIHSPFYNDQFGLGLTVINDKITVISQQEVSIHYSYKLDFRSSILSMGFKLGFNRFSSKYDELELDIDEDEYFQNYTSPFIPVFGIGAYYKSKSHYVGISVPSLYKFVSNNQKIYNIDQNKLVLLTGGYLFEINNDLKVKASSLVKADLSLMFEMDLNANVYYKEDYCFGISYKSLNSIALIFEIGFQKKYYIGYSYDVTTTKLIRCQAGTHEIALNIFLNRDKRSKVVNPRYF